MFLAVATCVALPALGPRGSAAGDERAEAPPIFKRSCVPAICHAPEEAEEYGVDFIQLEMHLTDELDIEKWQERIDHWHAQGKRLVAHLRPLMQVDELWEYMMSDSGLQEAVCRDLNLPPISQ